MEKRHDSQIGWTNKQANTIHSSTVSKRLIEKIATYRDVICLKTALMSISRFIYGSWMEDYITQVMIVFCHT